MCVVLCQRCLDVFGDTVSRGSAHYYSDSPGHRLVDRPGPQMT
jgi:hypothetical protein